MTYEQLMELGDRLGKVSVGLPKEKIDRIPIRVWRHGVTKT